MKLQTLELRLVLITFEAMLCNGMDLDALDGSSMLILVCVKNSYSLERNSPLKSRSTHSQIGSQNNNPKEIDIRVLEEVNLFVWFLTVNNVRAM